MKFVDWLPTGTDIFDDWDINGYKLQAVLVVRRD